MKNYIYIVINNSFNDWIKVGRTTNLKNRIDSYNTSSPYRNFEYFYYTDVINPNVYEYHFTKCYESNNYEWFYLLPEEGKLIINNITNNYYEYESDYNIYKINMNNIIKLQAKLQYWKNKFINSKDIVDEIKIIEIEENINLLINQNKN